MANGLFGGGTGTSADPYLVEDAQDLNAVRNKLSANYKQIANIDMKGFGNWEPINGEFNNFSYDGNGYAIKNLIINKPSTDNVGLFGEFGGTLKNIALIEVKVEGRNSVGSLVGYTKGGGSHIINNCHITGDIHGESRVGGLIGDNYVGSVHVSNCSSECDVTGSDSVGGLIGRTDMSTSRFTDLFMLGEFINRKTGSLSSSFTDTINKTSSPWISNCYSLNTLEFRQL